MAIQRSGRFDRIKKPLKSDMNVVPYIDVMLVLLVIFMVTAPMITTGVKVDLPQANNNPIQSEDRPTIVTLETDGTIKLEDKVHKNDVMTLDELKAVLVENQKQAETDKKQLTVLINGSESRPYGEVIKLMAALQDAGLSQVGLLTEPVK
ncbi:protein TolR [Acinetobacter rongchengensis]|uniref:Tol-Pal system protein TolR n=1 Tax=Acinetobacter rongchengensis TaxID=2419601 RepID=A0A3A8EUQ1_9GAMM|nr:protein TolR [Acinetobacter rongchengensis]RKG38592.1 protein TolR [Acinetobacter rongchengensis]